MTLLVLLALAVAVVVFGSRPRANARRAGHALPSARASTGSVPRRSARATAAPPPSTAPHPADPRPAAPSAAPALPPATVRRVTPTGTPAVPGVMPPTSRGLEFGRTYTRQEIRGIVGGGGLQDYLPHVGGRVIAGCFNPQLNPHAPFVVLPGFGPDIQRWAYVFASQDEPVPCFLKRAGNVWEYVGDYRVRTLSEDEAEVEEWSVLAGREGQVSMVLQLDAASPR